MTAPAFPPMPSVLSTTPADTSLRKPGLLIHKAGFVGGEEPVVLSRVAAAEQFGVGSDLHRIASRFDPPPPPTPEEQAEFDRIRAANNLVLEHWRRGVNLHAAFGILAECIALVEAHASALFDVDTYTTLMLSEWRELAHASLAALYDRSPELLPIGPAVHADCHGDDS